MTNHKLSNYQIIKLPNYQITQWSVVSGQWSVSYHQPSAISHQPRITHHALRTTHRLFALPLPLTPYPLSLLFVLCSLHFALFILYGTRKCLHYLCAFVPLCLCAFFFLSPTPTYSVLPAYIDWERGVVIGVGKFQIANNAKPAEKNSAREKALSDAKKNITSTIERLNIDTTATISEFLTANQDKLPLLAKYLNSAQIINEQISEDNEIKITISLPVEGKNGLKQLIENLKKGNLSDSNSRKPAQTTENKVSDTSSTYSSGKTAKIYKSSRTIDSNDDKESISISAGYTKNISEPYKIVLFDLENQTGYTNVDVGKYITERVVENFTGNRRFLFLSQSEKEEILKNNNKTLEEISNAHINDVMKIDGIDGLIVGKILHYEAETRKHALAGAGYLEISFKLIAELRLLEAKTGQWSFHTIPVELTDKTLSLKSADDPEKFILIDEPSAERGLAGKSVSNAVIQIIKIIEDSFPIKGYVLKVAGKKVYINLTQKDGIIEGDTLTVYRLGETLTDPLTGEEVDQIKDKVGAIKILEVKDKYSRAVIEETAGDIVQSGDIVSSR